MLHSMLTLSLALTHGRNKFNMLSLHAFGKRSFLLSGMDEQLHPTSVSSAGSM